MKSLRFGWPLAALPASPEPVLATAIALSPWIVVLARTLLR